MTKIERIASPVPPGEILRDEIESRGWSQSDLAEILDRPLQTINQILKGKKTITSATAHELEQAMNIPGEVWLNLESHYRLSLESRQNTSVAKRSAIFSRAPVGEMRRRKWLSDSKDVDKLEKEVLAFLGIKELNDPPGLRFAARKSTHYRNVSPSQEAWARRAFQLAGKMKSVPRFSQKKLVDSLSDIRSLGETIEGIKKIPTRLMEVGIRFLVVKHLPQTKIDGATFWLSKTRPVIVLSLRYGRIDYFLFTLFHELMHVRHNDANHIDNDLKLDSDLTDQIESRANREAASLLVSPEDLAQLRKRDRLTKSAIIRFAKRIRVHPGVLLGQLQHQGLVGWSACRDLLVPVRSEILSEMAASDGWINKMTRN